LADLLKAVNNLHTFHDETYKDFFLPYGYYTPGYLVALTAYLHLYKISERNFNLDTRQTSYLNTMALPDALWGNTNYTLNRCKEGINYSIITPLHNADVVDEATSSINRCIRTLSPNNENKGINDLFHVVGELHDNVWSHGLSSGFSMAQKSKVPYTNGRDHYFEFALADHGLGFLAEIKRSKQDITTHKEAIEWCIIEGHSTKHSDDIDDLAQSIPSDFIGKSPLGTNVQTRIEVNHHQGLGLAHLVKLVKKYKGHLYLISGDTCFEIDINGQERFIKLQKEWKGVAISCRFRESELSVVNNELPDENVLNIMAKLRGI
jgi:hypothetical protein